MKYVMFEAEVSGGTVLNIPVIFPKELVHSEVSRALMPMLVRQFPGFVIRAVSAGFANNVGVMQTTSKSESLNLLSRDQDRDIINTCDYGGHIR